MGLIYLLVSRLATIQIKIQIFCRFEALNDKFDLNDLIQQEIFLKMDLNDLIQQEFV